MDNKKIYDEKQKSMKRLNKYASVINDVLTEYNRKSIDETMMVKTFRRSNIETTTRKTHSENVENVASTIAERLGLNVPVVKLIAKHHDIGHTFLGHSGEWWLSEIKKNLGLGCYVHNSLGAKNLIYTHNVEEKIKKRIAYMYTGDEDSKDKELDKVSDDLWIIFDGINSHNGELSESTYLPNIDKTKADFEQELIDCHVIEGYDRKLVPATTEGCLMRLCDKISYIPFDMVDGLREGMIDKLDQEYIDVLVPILTSDNKTTPEQALQFINKSVIKEEYQELAGRLQMIFEKDVIDNSSEDKIAMSPEMSKRMHQLRDINNKKIVNYVLMQEDHEIYPKALEELMRECSQIIMDEKILRQLRGADKDLRLSEELTEEYKDTPYLGFVKYIANTTVEDFDWTQNMVEKARKQSIDNELDEALEVAKGNKKVSFVNGQEDRTRRIRFYEKLYQEQIVKMRERGYTLTDQDYQKMKEFQSENSIKKIYPSINESIALEFGAKYLASLSDTELMNLIKETGKITDKQYESLTRKYKDIDLPNEYMTHGQWDTISEAQSQATQESYMEK